MIKTIAHLPALCALLIASAGPGITRAEDLPRYRLQVGQQFVFHGDRHITMTDSAYQDIHSDWKVNVIRQNADGSWRMVSLVDSAGTYHEGAMTMPVERVVEAGLCDLRPDGAILGDDDPLVSLSRLFPRLPADPAQLAGRWTDESADHARFLQFQTLSPAPSPAIPASPLFEFIAIPAGGILGVFEPLSRYRYEFSRQTALVDRCLITSDTPDKSHSVRGEIRRTALHQLDPAIVEKIAASAKAYDDALARYKTAISAVTAKSGNVEATVSRNQLEKSSRELVAILFNDGRPGDPDLGHSTNAMIPDAPAPADILSKPAPAWTAIDLHGKPHSLQDFRGKVVLLDFGSRGCTWCMRQIPQLIRLHQAFKDKPVEIINMDGDTDPKDAKFVADAFQIPYLTVMAADAFQGYPIEGTPTVVIIDQQGIMRRRYVGYSMLGFDQFKATIDSLLNEAK